MVPQLETPFFATLEEVSNCSITFNAVSYLPRDHNSYQSLAMSLPHSPQDLPQDKVTSFECNKLRHAMRNRYIMIKDIDAVKHHATQANYKYGNRPRRLRALAVLGQQYSLCRIGENRPATPEHLCKSLENVATRYGVPRKFIEQLFMQGSDVVETSYMEKIRVAAEELATGESLLPANALQVIHAADEVEAYLSTSPIKSVVSVVRGKSEPTSKKRRRTLEENLGVRRLLRVKQPAPPAENELSTFSSLASPSYSRLSQTSGSSGGDEDLQSLVPHPQNDACTSEDVSRGSSSSQTADPSAYVDREYVETALKRLNNLVISASMRFLESLGIRDEGLSARFVDQPGDELEQLCAVCWGPQWRFGQQALREIKCLAMPNALIALVSAFLYIEVLRNGSRWQIKYVDMFDQSGRFRYPTLGLVSTYSSAACRDQHYKLSLGSQKMCEKARHHIRSVQSKAFADQMIDVAGDSEQLGQELYGVLKPHISILVKIAESLQQPEAVETSSWETRLVEDLSTLILKACELKLSLIESSLAHEFFWPECSDTFGQDEMLPKRAARNGQDLIVAFTTFPGIIVDWEDNSGEEVVRLADVVVRDRPQ